MTNNNLFAGIYRTIKQSNQLTKMQVKSKARKDWKREREKEKKSTRGILSVYSLNSASGLVAFDAAPS